MTSKPEKGAEIVAREPPGTSTVAALFAILQAHRMTGIALVSLGFLASLAEGVGIGLFIPFLQSLGPGEVSAGESSWLGNNLGRLFDGVSNEHRLLAIALGIFGAIFIKGVLSFGNSFLLATLSGRTAHNLRTQIFEKVLTADFRILDALGSGRLLNALSNESWRTADALTLMLQAFIAICTLLVYLALLILISWQLTIVVALLLAGIALLVRLLTSKVSSVGMKVTRANSDVSSKMVDVVDGVEVIRGYAQEGYERDRFAAISARLSKLTVRVGVLSGAVYPIYEILAAAILVTVLMTSGQSGASFAPLLVFVLLLYRLAPIVKRIEQARVELGAFAGAVAEVSTIIGQHEGDAVASGKMRLRSLDENIVLDNVSYHYHSDGSPAVENISARIPAKGLTAIVGPSGSGKSTLVKLLLRFFDPSDGQILVDGKSLQSLVLGDWREKIAVVTQKAFLFNATVRDNIAYGASPADDQAILAAATAAGAERFILELPHGFDTLLGESGVKLSGGEAQRICLARAMVRKPELLLLDEATNALDTISEGLIRKALDTLRGDCAVIVIAHRLATIESADQILVLDAGRLVEQGTLQQLVKQDGLFAELYQRQRF